jgi:hypothetical protein
MKKRALATSKKGWWNMTRKHRITATMESEDCTFAGVKFDKQGNIKKRVDIEVEPFNPELIFENEAFLKYIFIQLRKYLMERLPMTAGGYICFGNEHLEDRWIVTEQFCEDMGIGIDLIQLLVDHLDYPACEGDFVNDCTLDEVLESVRSYKKQESQKENK